MWLRFCRSGFRCLVKWSGPRSVNLASSLASRCQTMTRMGRPTATIARFLPRRLAMRRYRSPKEGVGSAGHDGGLPEGAGQVAVAMPGGSVAFGLAGGAADAG